MTFNEKVDCCVVLLGTFQHNLADLVLDRIIPVSSKSKSEQMTNWFTRLAIASLMQNYVIFHIEPHYLWVAWNFTMNFFDNYQLTWWVCSLACHCRSAQNHHEKKYLHQNLGLMLNSSITKRISHGQFQIENSN